MRTHKYRVWDTVENRMVLLDVPYNEGFIDIVDGCIVPASDQSKRRFIFLQFTGLLDKNGVEVFEGDICNWGAKDVFPYVIELVDGGFQLVYKGDDASMNLMQKTAQNIEVIGNIFSNPELLKGEGND